MCAKNERPRYFVAWRHKGENYWEAVSETKFDNLIEKLLKDGVNPASIIISMLTMANWLFPKYHKGCRTVWISDLYEEINGTSRPSDYSGPDVPSKKPKEDALYGFIAPDGRYFQCGYGCHSETARKIVGSVQKVDDPQQYLENQGWLVIYHDPINIGKCAVGMGARKKITDEQLKTVERIGLPTTARGMSELL